MEYKNKIKDDELMINLVVYNARKCFEELEEKLNKNQQEVSNND